MHDAAWILTAWLAVKLSRFNGLIWSAGLSGRRIQFTYRANDETSAARRRVPRPLERFVRFSQSLGSFLESLILFIENNLIICFE